MNQPTSAPESHKVRVRLVLLASCLYISLFQLSCRHSMSRERSIKKMDPVQRRSSARPSTGTHDVGPVPQNVGASQRFPSRVSGTQDTPLVPVRRESTTERSREPQAANVSGSEDRRSTSITPNDNPTSADKFIPAYGAYPSETVDYTSQKPDHLPGSQPGPTSQNAGQQYQSNSLPPPQFARSRFTTRPFGPQLAPPTFPLYGTRPTPGIDPRPPSGPYPTNPYTHAPYSVPYAGPQKMDAFIATDPFRSQRPSKNELDTTNLTFDNIPAMDVGQSNGYYPAPMPTVYPSHADPYRNAQYLSRPVIPPYPPFHTYSSHVPQNQVPGSTPPVIYNPDDPSTFPGQGDIRPAPNENATSVPISPISPSRASYESEEIPSTVVHPQDSATRLSPEEPETPVQGSKPDNAQPQGRLSPVRRTEDGEQSPVSPYNYPDGYPLKMYPAEYLNDYGPYFPAHDVDVGEKKTSFWSALGKPFLWPFSRPTPSLKYEGRPSSRPPAFVPSPSAFRLPYAAEESQQTFSRVAKDFVTRTLPAQVYLHVLLRLPSLYFSRVARIFEEADLTLPELKNMALETTSKDRALRPDYIFDSANVPPQYLRLKSTWEAFIDSVIRMENVQHNICFASFSAAQDPITRYTALSSLICALISLLFGCMYIIRFGSMRKTYKAAEWALEAKRTRTTIWWNVWVLLAMPAIWLTWSIILYIACIMTFLWRTSAQDNSPPMVMSKTALLTVRIVISSVLGLGLVYTTMILSTFSRYGNTMDKAWTKRINGWLQARSGFAGYGGPSNPYGFFPPSIQPWPHPSYSAYPPYSSYPPYPSYPTYRYPPGPIVYATPSRSSSIYEPAQNDAYGYPTDQKFSNFDSSAPSLSSSRPHPPKDSNNNPIRRNSENSIHSIDMYSMYMPYSRSVDPRHSHRPTSHKKDKTDPKSTSVGPNYTTPNQPPQTLPKAYVPPDQHPKGARKKRRLSVPPPDTLPTIPGTPGSSDLSYMTTPAQSSPPTSLKHDKPIGLGMQYAERLVEEPENEPQPDSHVHFRSPLVSAQERSFVGESDRGPVESERSSVSEPTTTTSTNVPWTPFPSPISPAY